MLNQELRVNTGLTYGAQSALQRQRVSGTVAISSFTKTETTEKAIDLALEVLGRLHKEGLAGPALDSVKTFVKGQYPPRLETGTALADKLTELALYDLTRTDVDTYATRVDQATAEDLKRVIRRVYPESHLVFVLIGRGDVLRDKIKKYGPVTEMDIAAPRFEP